MSESISAMSLSLFSMSPSLTYSPDSFDRDWHGLPLEVRKRFVPWWVISGVLMFNCCDCRAAADPKTTESSSLPYTTSSRCGCGVCTSVGGLCPCPCVRLGSSRTHSLAGIIFAADHKGALVVDGLGTIARVSCCWVAGGDCARTIMHQS